MHIIETAIPAVKILVPRKHSDPRGFFCETYNKRDLAAAGIDLEFVQDNHVLSSSPGVVRGLHFQIPPYAQAKLVRVTHGAIFDVAVDIRTGSSTFGHHVAVTLNAEDGQQLLVPVGFAHGYCTLKPATEVVYKVTAYYSPAHERGILWNDPDLEIPWPVSADTAELSARDADHRPLRALEACFEFASPDVLRLQL